LLENPGRGSGFRRKGESAVLKGDGWSTEGATFKDYNTKREWNSLRFKSTWQSKGGRKAAADQEGKPACLQPIDEREEEERRASLEEKGKPRRSSLEDDLSTSLTAKEGRFHRRLDRSLEGRISTHFEDSSWSDGEKGAAIFPKGGGRSICPSATCGGRDLTHFLSSTRISGGDFLPVI